MMLAHAHAGSSNPPRPIKPNRRKTADRRGLSTRLSKAALELDWALSDHPPKKPYVIDRTGDYLDPAEFDPHKFHILVVPAEANA